MILLVKKCIELIESGKLKIEQIKNEQVKKEVEDYFKIKEQSQ